MAKGKLSVDQVQSLKDMSTADLQNTFYANARNKEKNSGKNNPAQLPSPALADMLPDSIPNTPTTELSADQLALKYLDQATLETLPKYANGSAPETALMKAPPDEKLQTFMDRLKLSFGTFSGDMPAEKQVKWLQDKYGPDSAALSKGNNVTIKGKDGLWYQLDPSGAGNGSWGEKIFERTADIVADNSSAALGLGIALAAPVAAAAGGASASLAALTAAAPSLLATGAASGLASSAVKASLGRAFGTYTASPEDMIKDVGVETMLMAGGNVVAPGLMLTGRTMGAMFVRGAQKIASLPGTIKETMATMHSTLSGASKESFETALNYPKEYGAMLIKHGEDASSMLNANIKSTADLARETTSAMHTFYRQGIDDIATGAGEHFSPKIGQEINAQFEGLVQKGIMNKVEESGSIKYVLKSPTEIAKTSPTLVDELEKNNAHGLMKDYVNYLQKWSSKESATGKAGVDQYFKFKSGVNDIVDDIFTKSQTSGANQTFQNIKTINNQLKSNIVTSTVDGTKSAEFAQKLVSLEKDYGDMKNKLYPLLNAVKKAAKKGSDTDFATVFSTMFKDAKMTPKAAQAKETIEYALNKLAPFSKGNPAKGIESIADAVQGIRLRKAATELTPWLREGATARVGMVGAVATGNPVIMSGIALTSPRLNLKVAQVASSFFEGMNWMKALPKEQVAQIMTDPVLYNKFMIAVAKAPQLAEGVKQNLMSQVPKSAPQQPIQGQGQ